MPQPLLYLYQRHTGRDQQIGTAMPLRYNYDKPEKPRITRVFGYLARFFILFQTEKSSREVVMQIQEWLGHSDFSTTANIYAHLDYSSKLTSADAMLNGLGFAQN